MTTRARHRLDEMGSQATHNSNRQQQGRLGCRIDQAQKEQQDRERTRRKRQRQRDRKAGIR